MLAEDEQLQDESYDMEDLFGSSPEVGGANPPESKLAVWMRRWMQKLLGGSPGLHLEWLEGWRSMESYLDGQPLTVGTMFSGCDIIVKVLECLFAELRVAYSLNLTIEQKWLCEINKAKQKFLRNQYGPLYLFRDAAEVVELFSHNVVSDSRVAVPFVHLLAAGFPCTSKTALSSAASSHKQCIAQGSGATGVGFNSVANYVRANRPLLVVLENLAILTVAQDNQPAEITHIVKTFQDLGYWCSYIVADARDYGSFAGRERLYIVAGCWGPPSCGDLFLKAMLAITIGPGESS